MTKSVTSTQSPIGFAVPPLKPTYATGRQSTMVINGISTPNPAQWPSPVLSPTSVSLQNSPTNKREKAHSPNSFSQLSPSHSTNEQMKAAPNCMSMPFYQAELNISPTMPRCLSLEPMISKAFQKWPPPKPPDLHRLQQLTQSHDTPFHTLQNLTNQVSQSTAESLPKNILTHSFLNVWSNNERPASLQGQLLGQVTSFPITGSVDSTSNVWSKYSHDRLDIPLWPPSGQQVWEASFDHSTVANSHRQPDHHLLTSSVQTESLPSNMHQQWIT